MPRRTRRAGCPMFVPSDASGRANLGFLNSIRINLSIALMYLVLSTIVFLTSRLRLRYPEPQTWTIALIWSFPIS